MSSEPSLSYLQAAATRAQADYDYETAIGLYTEALELVETTTQVETGELEYGLRIGRATCFHYLARYQEGQSDLEAAVRQVLKNVVTNTLRIEFG